MLTLIVLNSQGASDTTKHESRAEARDQIETWSDPADLTARLYDAGELLYEGSAEEL